MNVVGVACLLATQQDIKMVGWHTSVLTIAPKTESHPYMVTYRTSGCGTRRGVAWQTVPITGNERIATGSRQKSDQVLVGSVAMLLMLLSMSVH